MKSNLRNEIKSYIVRSGYTMQEVVDLLSEDYGWSDSVSNLSNKLQRESLRYVEAVQLADALGYIRQDVEGFQEEWLQCRRSDQERNIREDRKRVEQAKKRLADLDVLLSRLYEDFVLGDLSKERYKKMTADYEAEQERLKLEIEVTEEWLETQETIVITGDHIHLFTPFLGGMRWVSPFPLTRRTQGRLLPAKSLLF